VGPDSPTRRGYGVSGVKMRRTFSSAPRHCSPTTQRRCYDNAQDEEPADGVFIMPPQHRHIASA
jgi:hypothetical protein